MTGEAFQRRRLAVKEVERREDRALVIVSVGGGFAQLAFIRWADAHLVRHPPVELEGGIFLAYIALVGILLWRFLRRVTAARPRCPQCGVALEDLSVRIATAAGRCDACGGQILA